MFSDNGRGTLALRRRVYYYPGAAASSPRRTNQEVSMSRILTKAEDIRQWAEARGGNPMMMDVQSGTRTRTVLQIAFGQDALNTGESQGQDRPGGFELVGWGDWIAALERENLALRVSDDPAGGREAEFDFVQRD